MGNINSTVNTIINESITDQSTKILNERFVPIKNSVRAFQDLDVEINVESSDCCDFTSDQTINIEQETINELDMNDQEDITKELEKRMKTDITNRSEQEIKDLPMGVNSNDVRNYVRNYDFHDLSLRVANKLVVDVNSKIESIQKGKYVLNIGYMNCCEGGKGIQIAQTMDVAAIVQNVVESKHVVAAVNDVTLAMENIITNENVQSNKGFNPVFWLFMFMLLPAIALGIIIWAATG